MSLRPISAATAPKAFAANDPHGGPDMDDAARLLDALAPGEVVTFQTFDDDKERSDKAMLNVRHGTLARHAGLLARTNAQGAGVFWMVNAGDGKGRKASNVQRVRALFADQDREGEPLEPLRGLPCRPHAIVQSSRGKWHAYWRVSDCPLDSFKKLQQAIAARFGSDPAVCDVNRVMRLPGFDHNKGEPYRTHVIEVHDGPAYTVAELVQGLALRPAATPSTPAPAGDADIIEVNRNNALTRMAGQLRHVGMDEADILVTLQQHNTAHCKPPLPDDEVRAIAQSIARYEPGAGVPDAANDDDEPLDLSHDALALQMGSDFGWNEVARYVHAWRSWLFWDGARWAKDDKLRHMTECRKFLLHVVIQLEREAKEQAKGKPDKAAAIYRQAKKTAEWLRSSATVAAVEGLARSNAELAATIDQFDANLDVIGTPGGTVDLRTGELRPTLRADYITRNVAVAPSDATPTRWLQFLHEVMDGDGEMVAFLQRLAGYALTGHTSEHKLPFLFGPGGNGKSVFANTLHGLFSDYSSRAPAEAFLQTRNERHPTDLAALAGARLVVTSELPAGRAWNESVIKDLTGGDPITARFMRQNSFTFTPQFALLIVGNHMPSLGSVDEAMRRRIVLVPFTHEVPKEKRDPELEAKLRAEWPGILQWAIEGAVAWYRDGLRVPDKVAGASGDYLDAEDVLGQFMEERLVRVPGSRGSLSSDVYADYAKWMEPRGGRGLSQRAFSQAMRERGLEIKKMKDGRYCAGWWRKDDA